MSGFSALIAPPDPVYTLAARAVCRTERVPAGERAIRQAVLLDAVVRAYVSYWIKTGRIEHYGGGGHGGHYSRGLAQYRVVRRGRVP